jgi:hypothetical protein
MDFTYRIKNLPKNFPKDRRVLPINVGGCLYNYPMNEKLEALKTEILDLMKEIELAGISGSTDDPNGDPRLFRIGNLLTIFDTFYHKEYVEFAYEHFVIPEK